VDGAEGEIVLEIRIKSINREPPPSAPARAHRAAMRKKKRKNQTPITNEQTDLLPTPPPDDPIEVDAAPRAQADDVPKGVVLHAIPECSSNIRNLVGRDFEQIRRCCPPNYRWVLESTETDSVPIVKFVEAERLPTKIDVRDIFSLDDIRLMGLEEEFKDLSVEIQVAILYANLDQLPKSYAERVKIAYDRIYGGAAGKKKASLKEKVLGRRNQKPRELTIEDIMGPLKSLAVA
jgi:hypothetical protein